MMKIDGKMYVKGFVEITPAALARLAEKGVVPPRSSCGGFRSFFLKEGDDGAEFRHLSGTPARSGELSLRSEPE